MSESSEPRRDERPRPQYGEYAPEGWVSPVADAQAPLAAAAQPGIAPADAPPLAPPVAAGRTERRTWDVVLTVALLGLGLYTVGSGYLAYSNLGEVMDQVFRQMGMGGFTSMELAANIGVAIMVSHTVIWVVGALLAARALKRNKIAFIWPLAAGVLATIVVFVLIAIVMSADPSFIAYVQRMSG